MPNPATPTNWWVNWDLTYFPNTFGEVVGGHSVQEALYHTMEKWVPTYIYEINRHLGSDVLRVPKKYRQRPENKPLSPGYDPNVLVNVPGTIHEPEVEQHATRVHWEAEIGIFIYGSADWQHTQALTYAYGTAIRTAILQHRDLGGLAETTHWVSEKYLEGEHNSSRTTGCAYLTFDVEIHNAVDQYGGPALPQWTAEGNKIGPNLLPPDPAPIIETQHVEVENDTQGD